MAHGSVYCCRVRYSYRVDRLEMGLSFYGPSLRVKRLAWSGYGFGHTARREPGDLRGTAVGKKGRFRGPFKARGGDD